MDILLAGSISYDYHMRYEGKFMDAFAGQPLDQFQVNFQVSSMQLHDGGVSSNIGYTMGLLGGTPKLFGMAGYDFWPYQERLEAVGVDCSTVCIIDEEVTAVFFSSTDDDGNQLGAFYAGAMKEAAHYGLFDVVDTPPDFVVISPNAPDAMARHIDECIAHSIPYLFDPSQQVAILDPEVMLRGIEGCTILTCNHYEWSIVQKHIGCTTDALNERGIVFVHTLGEAGAQVHFDGHSVHIPAVKPERDGNPTGAGDAFRGGFLRGLSLGFDWELCAQMGALCGTYALEYIGTQGHQFSVEEFIERFRQHYRDDGQLVALLRPGGV